MSLTSYGYLTSSKSCGYLYLPPFFQRNKSDSKRNTTHYISIVLDTAPLVLQQCVRTRRCVLDDSETQQEHSNTRRQATRVALFPTAVAHSGTETPALSVRSDVVPPAMAPSDSTRGTLLDEGKSGKSDVSPSRGAFADDDAQSRNDSHFRGGDGGERAVLIAAFPVPSAT